MSIGVKPSEGLDPSLYRVEADLRDGDEVLLRRPASFNWRLHFWPRVLLLLGAPITFEIYDGRMVVRAGGAVLTSERWSL